MLMIKLTEYMNSWKIEKFEWNRICRESALFEHQFWQGWVNDTFSEKNVFHLLLLNLDVMQTPWNNTCEINGYYQSNRT